MKLFGVINASPDSLHEESIVRDPTAAGRRAEWLLENGVWGFDLGGQGSTFAASETTVDEEWARLEPIIPVLLSFDAPISVDTWRPETARRSLDAGVSWLNAADGLQQDDMLALAAEYACPVVLPFLSGPDPLRMEHVTDHDPMQVLLDFFDHHGRLAEMVRNDDKDGFIGEFEAIGEFFGDFAQQAMEESGYLIHRLADRFS
jgi:dihydropteroate synthase